MFGKRTRFITMVAAALGVPYAWFNQSFTGTVRSTWSSLQGAVSSLSANRTGTPDVGNWSAERQTVPISISDQAAPRTPSIHQLADVLRFDITPRWVIDHWGRVSTVRAEQGLEGLRVALVTGTNLDDCAGSLTYYFDAQQQVRRIRLHGQTGEEKSLVALCTQHFLLRQEPAFNAGTYINRWNAKPMNVLQITLAPVIRADAPNTRLNVDLELNDLRAGYGLSPEFTQKLQAQQSIQRWGA